MPEMTEDEKAARLEFYKQQARTQWDARQRAMRTPSPWIVSYERFRFRTSAALAAVIAIAAVIAAFYNHWYWGGVALLCALPPAATLLRRIENGAFETSEAFWKLQQSRFFALSLWWLLFLAVASVCAIPVVVEGLRSAK